MFWRPLSSSLLSLFLLQALPSALGIGHAPCVSTSKVSNFTFPLVSNGKAATILVSPDEWPGVGQLAVESFATDIGKVTGHNLSVRNSSATALSKNAGPLVIIGTVDHSSLINALSNSSSIIANVTSTLRGQWESYSAFAVTLPNVGQVYVVIGSDKRGTIYGLYELSEQAGVSPWYWWADVPIKKAKNLYLSSCSHGPPDVKYRGIFINDEQPALQSWAQEKYTNGTGPPFNHFFYENLFELLLRLRANYLWPAMWAGMFAVDDPANQPLADKYGVVMGTSHQEPMARSTPNEWNAAVPPLGDWNFTSNAANVTQFWVESVERAKPYETVYTIGMRGAGDLPLSTTINIQNLEDIVDVQRGIFSQVFNTTDVTTIPQMWCLYEEVEGYYEDGMTVPDDVILLWTDDNWGDLRRYPTLNERNRTGGAGVYYHFDMVAAPRDYKWITSTQIQKVYEQMNMAIERDAKAMWIVNVGDLKPYELNIEFFITLGYDSSRFTPYNLNSYVAAWAAREFSVSTAESVTISSIIANLTRFNARRKPEVLNTTLYSLINYREAENVLSAWELLYETSLKIYNSLPSATKPAFFELVHHPVKASYQVANLYIAAGRNALYASQAKQSTNDYADQTQTWFDADYDLEVEYNSLLDGKWDHMMDQTHIGYYYWQQPMQNTMPAVSRVPPKKQALAGFMRITHESSLGAWPGDNPNQCALGYNCPPPTLDPLDPYMPTPSRWIDVSLGGPSSFHFTAVANVSWLTITPSSGTISTSHKDQRLEVSAKWGSVGSELAYGQVTITGTDPTGKQQPLVLPVYVSAIPEKAPSDFTGFVEGDGGVSIEASSFSRVTGSTTNGNATWITLPGLGRTLDGVTISPADGAVNYTVGTGPSLVYDFYTFNALANETIFVTTYVSPSLNANGLDRPLGLAVQVDDDTPQAVYFVGYTPPGGYPAGWTGMDGPQTNSIIPILTNHTAAPGAHTLTIWGIEPAVVVQKLVINTGNVRSSYLGPPQSLHV